MFSIKEIYRKIVKPFIISSVKMFNQRTVNFLNKYSLYVNFLIQIILFIFLYNFFFLPLEETYRLGLFMCTVGIFFSQFSKPLSDGFEDYSDKYNSFMDPFVWLTYLNYGLFLGALLTLYCI
jgi:hypothetical protein